MPANSDRSVALNSSIEDAPADMAPNDKVERREVASSTNETYLFQSSTPSFVHPARIPHDVEVARRWLSDHNQFGFCTLPADDLSCA
jgi:hypothetical protein